VGAEGIELQEGKAVIKDDFRHSFRQSVKRRRQTAYPLEAPKAWRKSSWSNRTLKNKAQHMLDSSAAPKPGVMDPAELKFEGVARMSGGNVVAKRTMPGGAGAAPASMLASARMSAMRGLDGDDFTENRPSSAPPRSYSSEARDIVFVFENEQVGVRTCMPIKTRSVRSRCHPIACKATDLPTPTHND